MWTEHAKLKTIGARLKGADDPGPNPDRLRHPDIGDLVIELDTAKRSPRQRCLVEPAAPPHECDEAPFLVGFDRNLCLRVAQSYSCIPVTRETKRAHPRVR